ncbi:hypothetical protein ACFWPV_10080 [Streptomyces uncialis]|uniref:hypothetical protein n=1 Tax=Streptomyces uncialis TaxID=1048205 RepID=UPI003666F85F
MSSTPLALTTAGPWHLTACVAVALAGAALIGLACRPPRRTPSTTKLVGGRP